MTICLTGTCQFDKQYNDASECQKKWIYKKLSKQITGTIIYHKTVSVHCGIFSTAAVGIILTQQGDTLRVLELCNLDKKFAVGSIIKVEPADIPGFRIDIVPYDPKVCNLINTYFGSLTKTK